MFKSIIYSLLASIALILPVTHRAKAQISNVPALTPLPIRTIPPVPPADTFKPTLIFRLQEQGTIDLITGEKSGIIGVDSYYEIVRRLNLAGGVNWSYAPGQSTINHRVYIEWVPIGGEQQRVLVPTNPIIPLPAK